MTKEYLNDFLGAYKDFTKAIELNPVNGDLYYKGRGELCVMLGIYIRALADYNMAFYIVSKNEPRSRKISFLHEQRGYILEGLGLYKDAIVDYENCIRLGLSPRWKAMLQERIKECKEKLNKIN